MINEIKELKYVQLQCEDCKTKFIQKVKPKCYACHVLNTHKTLFESPKSPPSYEKDTRSNAKV